METVYVLKDAQRTIKISYIWNKSIKKLIINVKKGFDCHLESLNALGFVKRKGKLSANLNEISWIFSAVYSRTWNIIRSMASAE